MGKEPITIHGPFRDEINYKAKIESDSMIPSFLDSPKEYTPKTNKNYGSQPKVKRLTLHKKSENKNRNL